jgi:A/G-specific adenine glycosylase
MALRKNVASQEIVKILLQWGKKNFRYYPWRCTKNSFHALIAEVMLQRTKAEQVLPVYTAFSSKYKTPIDIASDHKNVAEILRPLGLNWRAKLLIELTECISETGSVPNSFEELVKLPAVGQYVASAYLSLHADQKYSLIDANTVRVWGRIFGFKTDAETRRKKWFQELADDLTPCIDFKDFNYAVLDFSALICAKKPLCNQCALSKVCLFNLKNTEKA